MEEIRLRLPFSPPRISFQVQFFPLLNKFFGRLFFPYQTLTFCYSLNDLSLLFVFFSSSKFLFFFRYPEQEAWFSRGAHNLPLLVLLSPSPSSSY